VPAAKKTQVSHRSHIAVEMAQPSNLSIWGSKISSVAGPVKTTDVTIWEAKNLSLAGQTTKTMSLAKWSFKISSVAAAKTISLIIWNWQAQQRP